MSEHLKIRFQGNEYLLIGAETLDDGGAIATAEAFENGEASYAHLFVSGEDAGKVMRFGTEIGTKEDIEVIGTGEASPGENFHKGWAGPTWKGPIPL